MALQTAARLGSAALSVLLAVASAPASQSPESDPESIEMGFLEVGKPVERSLESGEIHVYRIRLGAGQYLKATVAQKGIDLTASFIDANGVGMLDFHNPVSLYGSEPVDVIAKKAGEYRIRVQAVDDDAPPGRYELQVLAVRTATRQDRLLAEASALEGSALLGFEESEEYLPRFVQEARRAVTLYEQALGPDTAEVAASLDILAVLVEMQGKFAEAERTYMRSLATYEKALGPDHPDSAVVLMDLGALSENRHELLAAETWYKRALCLREKAYGPDSPQLAGTLGDLEGLCETTRQYDKAEPLLVRRLMIRVQSLGLSHAYVLNDLKAVVEFYETHGQQAKTVPLFEKVLAMSATVHGPVGPRATQAHDEIVELFRSYGVPSGVKPVAQNAAELRKAATRSQASRSLFVCPEFRSHVTVISTTRSSMVSKVLPEYSRPNWPDWGFVTRGHLTSSVDWRSEA